jgi:kumamolisin
VDETYKAIAGSERLRPVAADDIGPADPNEQTSVTIVLRPRSDAHFTSTHVTKRLSERTYLTRDELATHRSALPEDIQAVERFALRAGLKVTETDPARRSVVVSGTVAQLAAAFHVELRRFRTGGAEFRGRVGAVSVPAELADAVTGVFGLDTRPQAQPHFRHKKKPHAADVSYSPLQVGTLYGFPADADGTGEAIALIELGGGYETSDLTTFFGALKITAPTVVSVGVDGAANAPIGNADSADGEVELDVEVAGSLANGARIVAYFAPNTDQGFLDAITTAIHDTVNHPSVISISWGSAESEWTAQAMTNMDDAFADAALLGITVCVAAGDGGSSDGETDGLAHVDFPASSPHVLGCGGTTLIANGTAIASETVWNDTGDGATGGGISDVFPVPAWQSGAGVPPSSNAGGRIGRGVPDVSGDADPATGYAVLVDGSNTVFGGTSAVAPLWAALIARLNQRAAKPLGLVNPILYANPHALRDITTGSNGAYKAGPGWDACTGLGSPNGALLETLMG